MESYLDCNIRASSNKTGNQRFGGDWILVDNGKKINIKDIYFNNTLIEYPNLLMEIPYFNWASIVDIIVAVSSIIYFIYNKKYPKHSKYYDNICVGVGLHSGVILVFQAWKLYPIFQFGLFLLVTVTIYYAYEAARLRRLLYIYENGG